MKVFETAWRFLSFKRSQCLSLSQTCSSYALLITIWSRLLSIPVPLTRQSSTQPLSLNPGWWRCLEIEPGDLLTLCYILSPAWFIVSEAHTQTHRLKEWCRMSSLPSGLHAALFHHRSPVHFKVASRPQWSARCRGMQGHTDLFPLRQTNAGSQILTRIMTTKVTGGQAQKPPQLSKTDEQYQQFRFGPLHGLPPTPTKAPTN